MSTIIFPFFGLTPISDPDYIDMESYAFALFYLSTLFGVSLLAFSCARRRLSGLPSSFAIWYFSLSRIVRLPFPFLLTSSSFVTHPPPGFTRYLCGISLYCPPSRARFPTFLRRYLAFQRCRSTSRTRHPHRARHIPRTSPSLPS